MAMTLQKTRLRLTQAIYFGFPPVAVGSGFIKADGSVPLTADWNAGNFNINSRNSTLWFNVVAYGADRTGAGSSVAAVTAAIAAASSGGVIYFPRGIYKIDQEITIGTAGITLLGDGPDGTAIDFTPAPPPGPKSCFKFTAGAGTINNCGVYGMRFTTTDAGMAKTAIDVIDAVNFFIERVNVTGAWTGASASTGFKISGRQLVRVRNCAINAADLPIVIGVNPNFASLSFDHCSIESSELVCTAAMANPVITITDGAGMTNASFRHLGVIRGSTGISMNNTLMATAYQALIIDDIRTEQTVGAAGYSIDLRSSSGQIQDLAIKNVVLDPGRNGIRLTNAKWPSLESISYGGTNEFLNLSATVEGLTIKNSFRQAGSTVTDASVNPTANGLTIGANPTFTSFGALSSPGTVPLAVGTTSQMKVNSTGQIALGGATADQDLTLSSVSQVHFIGGNTNIYSKPAAPGATTLNFNVLASGAQGWLANGASFRLQSDASDNGSIHFATTEAGVGNFERVTITNAGNVGIQTATPTRALDLNGPQRWRGMAAPAVSEANSGIIYFDSTSNKFKASLNGSAYVDVIGSGGLTGSGSAGRVAYWDTVASLASPTSIYIDAANNRVGINVAAPTERLHIDGDINIENNPATIKVAGAAVAILGALNASTMIGGITGTLAAADLAVGQGALSASTGAGTGDNTAVGTQALLHVTTGDTNTAVGSNALSLTTIGTDNVALGATAGGTNTTGTNNIFIGSAADASVGNLNHAVAFGTGASIADSNAMNIGGGIQKVGIAISTPKCAFDVNGAVANRQYEATLINGLNSDITSLVQSSWWRIVGPGAGFSVGGFVMGGVTSGVSDGLTLTIYNTTAQQMTIVNEDASSTAINRIKTLTGGNVVLRAGTSAASFRYDVTDDRWILVSSN